MRKIIVLSMITLDGVIQAPGDPEEDPTVASGTVGGQFRTLMILLAGLWESK